MDLFLLHTKPMHDLSHLSFLLQVTNTKRSNLHTTRLDYNSFYIQSLLTRIFSLMRQISKFFVTSINFVPIKSLTLFPLNKCLSILYVDCFKNIFYSKMKFSTCSRKFEAVERNKEF
jgi:hypothetical protein